MRLFLGCIFIVCSVLLAQAGVTGGSAVEVGTEHGHGSGVYIGNGYVLTAGHVATGNTEMTIRKAKSATWSDTWTAHVLWIDAAQDFALLKINAAAVDLEVAKITCTAPLMGQDLTIVGWPRNLGMTTTRGYIAAEDAKRDPWAHSFIMVAPITFGNSGGPVYDAHGAVIALAVGILDGTSLSLIVPLSAICDVLPAGIL